MGRLQKESALLVIVDVQERLVPVILEHEAVLTNIERLVRGFHLLSVPVLLT